MKGSNLSRVSAWWPAYLVVFILSLVALSVGCHSFASGINIPEMSPISIFSHQTIAEEGGVAVGQNGSYSAAPGAPESPTQVAPSPAELPVSRVFAVFLFGVAAALIILAILGRILYPVFRRLIAADVAQLYKPISRPVITRKPTELAVRERDSINIYQGKR